MDISDVFQLLSIVDKAKDHQVLRPIHDEAYETLKAHAEELGKTRAERAKKAQTEAQQKAAEAEAAARAKQEAQTEPQENFDYQSTTKPPNLRGDNYGTTDSK